jgi:hypothetical protein
MSDGVIGGTLRASSLTPNNSSCNGSGLPVADGHKAAF